MNETGSSRATHWARHAWARQPRSDNRWLSYSTNRTFLSRRLPAVAHHVRQ